MLTSALPVLLMLAALKLTALRVLQASDTVAEPAVSMMRVSLPLPTVTFKVVQGRLMLPVGVPTMMARWMRDVLDATSHVRRSMNGA
jgi:hypothetical protein